MNRSYARIGSALVSCFTTDDEIATHRRPWVTSRRRILGTEARERRHQQLQFADAVLFGQDFRQRMLRPAAARQMPVELVIAARETGQRVGSRHAAPDPGVLQQLLQGGGLG